MNIYDIKVKTSEGEEKSLSSYKGKVMLIVNTASKCGFTPQYEDLETLYKTYDQEKFVILAFPSNQFMNQEPLDNKAIQNFCLINYGVSFPLFEKTNVNGKNAHPLFKHLTGQSKGFFGKSIKWNFTKFLVDQEGNFVERFAPTVSPLKMKDQIEKLLKGAVAS